MLGLDQPLEGLVVYFTVGIYALFVALNEFLHFIGFHDYSGNSNLLKETE